MNTTTRKNEYYEAAKIMEEVAENGIQIRTLFALSLPFVDRSGYANLLNGSFNWGREELDIWKLALSNYKKRETKAIKKRNVRAKYQQLAKDFRKKGDLVAMMGKVHEVPFISEAVRPSQKAFLFHYLFHSLEPSYQKRQARLMAIFAFKVQVEDEKWVKMIYDYSRISRVNAMAEKIAAKY